MSQKSRKKSPARAFLWLLMIPAQLVLDMLLIAAGAGIDSRIFGSDEAVGHGMPIFTVLMPILAIVLTVIVVILSIVLTIVRYSKLKKEINYR